MVTHRRMAAQRRAQIKSTLSSIVACSLVALGVVVVPQVTSPLNAEALPYAVTIPDPSARIQRFQGDSSDRYVAPIPAGGSSTSDYSAWVTASGEARASHGDVWGQQLSIDDQSVIGITPRNPGTVTEGQPFVLAQFKHYNNPIQSADEEVTTALQIRLGSDVFDLHATLNETPNSQSQCPSDPQGLWDPASRTCRDVLEFDSRVFDGEITLGGYRYKLAAQGFTEVGANGQCSASQQGVMAPQFITDERTTTTGCMYASLERVRQLTITKRIEDAQGNLIPAADLTPAAVFNYSATSSLGSARNLNFNLSPNSVASETRELLSTERIDMSETVVGTDPNGEWGYTSLVCRDVTGLPVGQEAGATISTPGTAADAGNGATVVNPQSLVINNVIQMATTPDHIECTFTNTYTPKGRLSLVKEVVDDLEPPNRFTLTASGPTTISGQGNSAAVTNQVVTAGQYTLSETGPAYFVQDGDWTCTGGTVTDDVVTVADDANVTCTVTNRPAYGDVEVAKVITGPEGAYVGTEDTPFTGSIECTAPSGASVSYPAETFSATTATAWAKQNLVAGTVCRVASEDPPAQQLLDNISYSWSPPDLGGSVTISDDTTQTITINNPIIQSLGSLRIGKTVAPAPGTVGPYTGGSTRTFAIDYSCTLDGETVAQGTVNQAAGTTSGAISVPSGAVCSVTEQASAHATQPGDFPNASYSWLAPTNPAHVTITTNVAATATVANTFQQQFGSITLTKTVTGPGAGNVAAGTTFGIEYNCGSGWVPVSLAAGGSTTINDLPLNTQCSFREPNPPTGSTGLPAAYAWGSPSYSNGGQVTVATTPNVGTVTNPTNEVYAQARIRKAIAGATDGLEPGSTFLVDLTCTHPVTGVQNYAVTGAPVTLATPFVTPNLAVGTECSVTEQAPGQDLLVDDSYRWAATPAATTVTATPRGGIGETTITNTIERVFGSLSISKVVIGDGYTSGGFSGTWSCPANATAGRPASGTWSTDGSGPAIFSTGGTSVEVVYNAACTVTENTGAGQRPALDPVYAWLEPVYAPGSSVTVNAATPNQQVAITNETVQVGSHLRVEKQLGTNPQGAAANAEFVLSGTCVHPTDPSQTVSNSWTLSPGEQGAADTILPVGWNCTVTESGVDAADLIDDARYRWNGVTWSTTPDTPLTVSADGYTVSLTVPEIAADETGVLTATNHIAENRTTLTVEKVITGLTEGYDGAGTFHVDVSCGAGGADGVFEADLVGGGSANFDVPVNTTCTVTESALTGSGLVDESFAWNSTSYTVDGGTAVTTAPTLTTDADGVTVTVQNEIIRVTDMLSIQKTLTDPDGVVAADREFSGTWQCSYTHPTSGVVTSYPSAPGDWTTTAGAAAVLLDDGVPLGSVCSVISEDLATPPTDDPSYEWADFSATDVTISEGGNVLQVTNGLRHRFGTLTVNKELDGATEGYVGTGADFTFGYVCVNPADPTGPTATGSVNIPVGETPVQVTDQIPFGWQCSGYETAPAAGLLNANGSYSWSGSSVDPAQGVLDDDQPIIHVTVTNSIARNYANFSVTKVLQGVPSTAVTGPFTGSWQCAYDTELFEGSWRAPAAGGVATMAGDGQDDVPGRVPVGSTCEITEGTPPAFTDPSWTWNDPVISAPVTIAPGATSATATVTNSASRVTSTVSLQKLSTVPPMGLVDGAEVTGSYSCSYEGNPDATSDNATFNGRWTLPASGGKATLVTDAGATAQVPAGSVCTLREDTLGQDLLIDESYRWLQPTYTPANATGDAAVFTAVPGVNEASVTNGTERVYGSFGIDKDVVAIEPAAPDAIDRMDNVTYAGEWECVYTGSPATTDDDVTTRGPWSTGNNPTEPETIGNVLIGSECRVLTEDTPARPFRTDPSYVWVDRDLGDPVTVGLQTVEQTTVTNTFTRLMGDFQMLKTIIGADPADVGDPIFQIDWTCETGDGTPDLSGPNEPIMLEPGVVFSSPQPFPDGTSCSMTEAIPDPVEGYTWLTPYWNAINYGEDGTFESNGYTGTGTFPVGDQEVFITLFNPVVQNGYTVTKTSDPTSGTAVMPGQQVTYTITVTPEEGYARNVVVTDTLSDVLDNAVLDEASIAASQGTATLADGVLTWTLPPELRGAGPDLSSLPNDVQRVPWESTGAATLTYTVTVGEAVWGELLNNTVGTTGDDPCIGDCEPTTQHPVPGYSLTKSSDPVDGSVVEPGQVVTYLLTVQNTSTTPVTNAVVGDDLSDVLDDADWLGVVGTPAGTAELAGQTLTWTVDSIPVGGSAELRYQAKVRPDVQQATLRNVATQGPGGECVVDCETEHPVASYLLAKTSDPLDGSTVAPGSTIEYSLAVTNTGPVVLTGRAVTDDLSGVLDNATLSRPLPEGLTLNGTTLTWQVPDVAVGAQTEISYRVTVHDDATGVTLRNVATPADSTGVCEDDCSTTHSTSGTWTLSKSSDPASGSRVFAGSTITYTLTVTGGASGSVSDVVVTDDIPRTIGAHGSIVDRSIQTTAGTASLDPTGVLVWEVGTVSAGERYSLTFEFRVNGDVDGVLLRNVIEGAGEVPPTCDGCETTHTIQKRPVALPRTGVAGVEQLAALVLFGGGAAIWFVRHRRRD